MIDDIYEAYGSRTAYHTQYKTFFEDADGYPNKMAFEHFAKELANEKDDYFLACICVDLHYANNINYAFGSYTLRKFFNGLTNSVKNCYLFRITGDKFNALIKADNLEDFKDYIANGAQQCEVFCGIVEEPFAYEKSFELIQQGIVLMYRNRSELNAAKKEKNNTIYGSKGNTPPELQETKVKKFRKTMWQSVIDLVVDDFTYQQVTLYVFPTRLAHTLEAVPLLVVIYDMVEYRVFYGKDIKFGVGGVVFGINGRFSRDGHFGVTLFKPDEDGKKNYEINSINTTEGVCIPANFGKRVGKDEIYPIRQNIENLCDYVLLKDVDKDTDHDPTVVTSGTIEVDGVKYGVYMDDECIDLLEV